MVSSIVHSSFKNYNILNDLGPLDEDLEPMDEAQSSAYLHSINRNKIEELSKLLLSSSFDINDQSCLTILKVISASQVVKLSLKNITFHPNWLIKLLLIKEQFPSAQFQFSQRDIHIFEKIRRCFILYYQSVIPNEIRQHFLNRILRFGKYRSDQLVIQSSVSAHKSSNGERQLRFYKSIYSPKDISTFRYSEDSRDLIDLFENTSISEGAFCINDQLHLFNDAGNLLHLNDSEESCLLNPLNALKIKALKERVSSHIEKRLQLFYALTIVMSNLDFDGTYCKCEMGSTIYQVGSGHSKLQFQAAHSAIIPNPIIQLDEEAINKILITDKDNLLDYLSKLCIFMGKDSKIFDQYKKELETSDLTEIKKLLANVEFKQFFCMNLVPIESYLGQNLASTVCLPKNCNEFDGIIEKKIRDSAAKLLTQLLKNEKAGKRSQIVPKDPYNVSTKFNELFTMALREALKELEKEISSIEERIEKLKLLEPILLGLKSPEPEGIFGALRLFSENAQYFFSPPLQLFPRETLRYLVKNFYNELQQYLIESLKEKFKDEDPKNFDEIFLNLSQLKEEQYDEIIAYHELMIEKCAEIFSSIPKKRGIDFNEISYKKRKDSDKISSVQEIDFEKILKNIKAKSLKVKDIKRFWNSIQYNILQNHIYFWFGDFYSLESLEYIIKEISSVLHTDQAIVDSLLPQSSLEKTIMELNEQLEPLKEKLALAKFSIKRCEKISQLKDSFFESFKDQSLISDLELDNGGEKKEVIENPLALNVQTVKVLNKSILKRAKECLLAPFVTINKIEKSPLKPTGFLNQPIFYIIERVNDSDKYPRGLKIIFDSDQYTKLKHFSSFFKSHLKQRYDNGLKLKIGQNVRGVFFV